MLLATKFVVLDTRKSYLKSITTTGLATTHAIVHEEIHIERKMKAYEDNISFLENQFEYYNSI
jgi:hypothetical protein